MSGLAFSLPGESVFYDFTIVPRARGGGGSSGRARVRVTFNAWILAFSLRGESALYDLTVAKDREPYAGN